MKYAWLALVLLSSSAYARQYIQCADYHTFDRAVINLNGEESTLFMTTGVHDPDERRVLRPLEFGYIEGEYHVFESKTNSTYATIHIPSDVIGKSSNKFDVLFAIEPTKASQGHRMVCFSAIYENK